MLILITPHNYARHQDDLKALYNLRSKIMQEKQLERLMPHESIEKEVYDEKNAYHLLYKDEKGTLKGCMRFIEMIHPCLLDEPRYAALSTVHNVKDFKRPNYWEISRMVIDDESHIADQQSSSKEVMLTLLAGYTLFGLEFGCECSLMIGHPKDMETYQRYGLILSPVSDPPLHPEGNHAPIGIASYTPTHYGYDKLIGQTHMDRSQPILWMNSGWYKEHRL